MNEDYSTHDSEDFESKVTKENSQEVVKTITEYWDTFKLDEFLLNSQVPAQSRNIPVTSRNSTSRNQEVNEDCTQNDYLPAMMRLDFRISRNAIPGPTPVLHH